MPLELEGRTLFIDFTAAGPSLNRSGVKAPSRGPVIQDRKPPSNTLFVANIPYSVDDQELHRLFEPYGTIRAVRIGG